MILPHYVNLYFFHAYAVYVYIDKELERASKNAIEALGKKNIFYIFPPVLGSNASTRLILKTPKTESSVRKIWLPKTVACILREWKKSQDERKRQISPPLYRRGLI